MMGGYLLARAGVEVVVLEKHPDFNRDFRGDTIHPSTLQLMSELGLLEEFLKVEGVSAAVVVGRDRFVIESAVSGKVDIEALGAMASTGLGTSEAMGNTLGKGELYQMLVHQVRHVLLVAQSPGFAVLGVGLGPGLGVPVNAAAAELQVLGIGFAIVAGVVDDQHERRLAHVGSSIAAVDADGARARPDWPNRRKWTRLSDMRLEREPRRLSCGVRIRFAKVTRP